jgi:hypothetical protein
MNENNFQVCDKLIYLNTYRLHWVATWHGAPPSFESWRELPLMEDSCDFVKEQQAKKGVVLQLWYLPGANNPSQKN